MGGGCTDVWTSSRTRTTMMTTTATRALANNAAEDETARVGGNAGEPMDAV
jgi:hypothetical protein